jgi:hypothetical protein
LIYISKYYIEAGFSQHGAYKAPADFAGSKMNSFCMEKP